MTAHADTFDQSQPLGKWVLASIALHIAVTAALLAHNFIKGTPIRMGDPHGGGFGAVAVNTVATIPLPARTGPTNPVANDTESKVPTPPPKTKAQPKVHAPDPNAIAIGKFDKRKPAPLPAAAPNKYREQQKYSDSQLYSNAGQSISTPMYGRQGGGGVGIGNSSPFGTQFGAYASMLQQTIARNWHTSDVDPRISSAPLVTVAFTIQKDGSVAPGSLRITQRSGILPLDYSAQRAILDSAPFQPLPPGFPRASAEVEMRFELRR
jgi:outer membrane biosynthesis protein TonB